MNTELLIQIIILLLALYLAFFKSYLSEKGKSAALKEDLANLTHEVEKVKSEFSREQEILKAELERALSNEVSYQNEVRNALINFHGIISEWLYSILEVSVGNYNKANVESFIASRSSIARFYAKAGIAKSRVELLVEDETLIDNAGNLYSACLAFHSWTDKQFLLLQQNIAHQRFITDQFLVVFKDYQNNKEIAKSLAEDDESLRDSAKELNENYMKNRNVEYFKVKPIEKDFSDRLKEYLKK